MTETTLERIETKPTFQEVRKHHSITINMLIEDAQVDPRALLLLDTWDIGETPFIERVLESLSRLSGKTYHRDLLDIGSFEKVMDTRGAITIFPFLDEPKQLLLQHGCTFQEGEDAWTIQFPEGTICTPLIASSLNRYEERSCIVLPDGLELCEVRDPETGKSWLSILIHEKPQAKGEDAQTEEARNIAHTIAVGSIRQAVYYVFLGVCPVGVSDKKQVIAELHTIANELEALAKRIIKQQEEEKMGVCQEEKMGSL